MELHEIEREIRKVIRAAYNVESTNMKQGETLTVNISIPGSVVQFGEFNPNIYPYPGSNEHLLFHDSELDVKDQDDNVSLYIIEGEKLVFMYGFTKDDDPNIADDEYGETVFFEVDPDVEEFHIDSNNLDQYMVTFGRFCYCIDGGYHHVDEGCIHGEKISEDKWKVSFSLRITSTWEPITMMVDAEFTFDD